MTCPPRNRQAILDQIEELEAQLEVAYQSLQETLAIDIEEYSFDSGLGRQKAVRRDISQFTKAIEWLTSRIDYLYRKLTCRGLVNVNVRRKGYNQHIRRRF
jgi:hypothetical protein